MTPFSELYSKYYTLVTHILQLAQEKPLTLEEIRSYLTEKGFLETPAILTSLLTAQDDAGYHLLLKEENRFTSVLKHAPTLPTTSLEACWLKALLEDPKIGLFLNEDDLYHLKKALASFNPLYTQDMICYARQGAHDTLYKDPEFQKLFKTLNVAIRDGLLLEIVTDHAFKGSDNTLFIAPYKLEYAIKEDHFSLLAICMKADHTPFRLMRISLASILSLKTAGPAPGRCLLDEFARSCKSKEPVIFTLYDIRSGFERAFMSLSPYERVTQFNEADHTCLVKLYYYPFDEAALIDTLISFGPVLKISSPDRIKQTVKKRIDTQALLFANFFSR